MFGRWRFSNKHDFELCVRHDFNFRAVHMGIAYLRIVMTEVNRKIYYSIELVFFFKLYCRI